jgi:hypothetical protein
MKDSLLNAFLDRLDKNGVFVKRYVNDTEFREFLSDALTRRIYSELREEATAA